MHASLRHVKFSPEMRWEKVRAAVVKTDRRVYRLVQTRLNELAFSDKFFADVGTCIEKAAHLVQEPGLTPNLVAELDREWKMITSVDQRSFVFRIAGPVQFPSFTADFQTGSSGGFATGIEGGRWPAFGNRNRQQSDARRAVNGTGRNRRQNKRLETVARMAFPATSGFCRP